ncbi:MAG: IS200/IS605 family transposase [Mycobacterium sp.]
MPATHRDTDVRRSRSAVDNLHTHLVFVTKYRRPAFTDTKLTFCQHLMRDVCAEMKTELREFNGEADHVHLLVHYPPPLPISLLVNRLKCVSSRRLRQQYRAEVRTYPWGKHFWSPSYFAASCRGAPPTVIKQYIEQQNRPNRRGQLRRPNNGIGLLPAVNGRASAEECR